MLTFFFLLSLGFLFAFAHIQVTPEEMIVGVWKHHQEEVSFVFFDDGNMRLRIPVVQGVSELSGRYKLIEENLLQIQLDYQYGLASGQPMLSNPQVLKVTIHENEMIFHDLKINEPEEQLFIRIK